MDSAQDAKTENGGRQVYTCHATKDLALLCGTETNSSGIDLSIILTLVAPTYSCPFACGFSFFTYFHYLMNKKIVLSFCIIVHPDIKLLSPVSSFFVISWSSKITSSFLCSLLLFLWWLKNKLYFYDCFVTFQKIDKNLLIKKIDNLVIMVMHFQVVMKCAEKQIEYEETATKS